MSTAPTADAAPAKRKRVVPPTEVVISYRPLSKATQRELLARERGLALLLLPVPGAAP